MNGFPSLARLFGAYLHQDWEVEFSSPWDAVRVFRKALSSNEVTNSIKEIAQLLMLDDPVLSSVVFGELGLGYWPQADGHELREWLGLLADELR
jgi:deoxyxylulose-5-phosphate synthase